MKDFTEGVVSTSEMAFDISFAIAIVAIVFASVVLARAVIRRGFGLCQEVSKINYFDDNSKAPLPTSRIHPSVVIFIII